jgi:hypothetical protein
MLGFAWMLRNEAARVLREALSNMPAQASVAVFNVAHAACAAACGGWKEWFYPQDFASALALLTAHNHNAEPRELAKGETE